LLNATKSSTLSHVHPSAHRDPPTSQPTLLSKDARSDIHVGLFGRSRQAKSDQGGWFRRSQIHSNRGDSWGGALGGAGNEVCVGLDNLGGFSGPSQGYGVSSAVATRKVSEAGISVLVVARRLRRQEEVQTVPVAFNPEPGHMQGRTGNPALLTVAQFLG
jgi:hypothetical protein